MAEVKITDLVDPSAIEQLTKLNEEMQSVLGTYTNVAKELAKGVDVKVSVIGDLDKLEKLLTDKTKEASTVNKELTEVVKQQQTVINNTTNTISRQLMEQEKVNKSNRDAYTEYDRVKSLLEQVNGTYENNVRILLTCNKEIASVKKAQDNLKKSYESGRISLDDYNETLLQLTIKERELQQQKASITTLLKNEERENQAVMGSYNQLSQQLELLKKAYKSMTEEEKNSQLGIEMESAIQNLDAHLKDLAADMGEFQRNVGNYAIAGQNGVVTSESLMAVLQQETKTVQDLIDQNKILEEGVSKLDRSDKNYTATVNAVNDKLAENRKSLTDVSDILGKQPKTVAEAEEQNRRLAEALKYIDLTADGAKEKIEEINAQLESNKEIISDVTGSNESFADSMLQLIGINGNFGSSLQGISASGNFLDGMKTKVAAFGKTLLGLLANPWVLVFLGISGVAAGFKWWYEYNKGLAEATKLTKQYTGLAGDELKQLRNEIQATADMYEKDFREVMIAANAMAQQFGISYQEAMHLIQEGFQSGADVNGEFLENIKEYPAYFKEAGISASEFIAITTQANQAGIYSDKGIDVIKEGNLRIREMTSSTAEALDAIGISSEKVKKELTEGSKTTFDIIKEVSAKLAELPESSSEVGTALADIFGGPGEDAGLKYITMLKDMDTNLDNVKDKAGELAKLEEEQLRSQVELENTLSALFDFTGGSFESMTTSLKVFTNDTLTALIKGLVDVCNWFIELYNESAIVRVGVNSIGVQFKVLWSVCKNVFGLIVDELVGLGNMIKGALTLDWDEFSAGFEKFRKASSNAIKEVVNDTVDAYKDAWENMGKKIDKIELPVTVTTVTTEETKTETEETEETEETDEIEEAKKAAEELAKIDAELEQMRINAMQDGLDKQLAQLRLNYKKRLDTIKGESEKENNLRVAIMMEMETAIAKLQYEYEQEQERINTENRLAIVKEGGKEWLELRKKQLKKEYDEEIKNANKTGADVLLIQQKYAKLSRELDEQYASSQVEEATEQYADEQKVRDRSFTNDMNALKMRYASELSLAGNNAKKREQIEAQYQKDVQDLTYQYGVETLQSQIDMYKQLLDTADLSADQRKDIEEKLAQAEMDLDTKVADHAVNNAQNTEKTWQQILEEFKGEFDKWGSQVLSVFDSIAELMSTIYDAQIEKIEEEQEANEEAGEEEQERISELVEKNVITEEEGEARKRAAEIKTAQKTEELEKKKAELQYKQAVWEKANSLAQTTFSTSLAIMNALTTQPFWVGIALAAVAGAMGAAQIATIIATPIPQYAKGTERHKGGLAIVGDGGQQEVITFGKSAWVTPDTPTLVDIPAGASVIPSVDRFLQEPVGLYDSDNANQPNVVVNNDFTPLKERLDNVIYILTGLSKEQRRAVRDAQRQQLIISKGL